MNTFKEITMKPFILKALDALKFETLTPVQSEVIPAAINNENLMVQSQTGSGKTHSFLIPIFNKIDPTKHEVQVVITAPSRELATQLYDMAQQIASFSPDEISLVKYIGGTDKGRQIERLKSSGQPQIVIGTPGRIFDLMKENALWVQTAHTLIIDEADMTMDLGFFETVDEIASRMPSKLQFMVFSATIPQKVEVFLNKYMASPKLIQIEPKQLLTEHVENYLINTRGRSREKLVYDLLTMGHPYLALVFCNTRQYADELSLYLKNHGLKIATIHGGIPSRERARTMRQIKNLDYQYVVASDLAARGIDIPGISMVINTEIPTELEFFVHRIGRTGRNQLAGTAYTLVTPDNDQDIAELESKGIEFTQVDLSKGEIVPATSRHQRRNREDTQPVTQDPVVKGMIGRNKKRKVKPGYKRKLTEEIKQHRRQKAKQTGRQTRRAERTENKNKNS